MTLMTSRSPSSGPESCQSPLEEAARAALNLGPGLALTEAAWARARTRLLEFVIILRAWDRQGAATEPGS